MRYYIKAAPMAAVGIKPNCYTSRNHRASAVFRDDHLFSCRDLLWWLWTANTVRKTM